MSQKSVTSAVRISIEEQSVEEIDIIGDTSPGVRRARILKDNLSTLDQIIIFLCLFLLAYVYGLDGALRSIYQPYATSGFATHSTLATINVLRSVIAAAAQPTAAKIADVFGRPELIIVSVVFYIVGTIVEATCPNVEAFAAGAVIYQVGYTSILVLVEIVIADITFLEDRLLFSYIPTLPFLINAWVSGNISTAVLGVTTWRWGVGMFAIIYTCVSIPLIIAPWLPYRRAQKAGALENHRSTWQTLGTRRLVATIFWQLDLIGIILLIAVFALILNSGASQKVIALLIIGIFCIPVWIWWEKRAPYAMVPFTLLRDRDFLYTVLVVAFDESIKSATRISSLYSFCFVLSGALLGLIVRYYRYLKPFIVFGTVLFLAAFGVLIHYRGGSGTASHSGIIGSQVLLGIAGGLFPYPAQASIQAATKHEHVAVITGLYLATYNIGSAFGNTVSGAIWTQTLIPTLLKNLPPPYNNMTIAQGIYESPFEYAINYPIGTPLRDGIVTSYRHTQRLLTVTGICLCVPLIFFSLLIRNPKLGKEQSLPDAEEPIALEDRQPWWRIF
ncbi:siderochrome-iron transporter-like protein Sit1 [Mytilinidion resinicola]|uniref:Siderochrome-iron transporter-like protein Sit1 n=1 Tax=Mytilinidion resinicola TaxID=574789 RepID=A0A6A6YZW1_9PEZI|nr:siderochrome-iron transporter-like protein Sit1 [Mytilinidion resinicola]KAF2813544.1 siderochrome-iron transporter-like protein Sit1 [Mytilinidion resinicola]